jgi:hypothetical protein
MVQMTTEDPPQTAAAKALIAHRWAKVTNRTEATAPGRAAFWKRFLDEVDPDRELTEDERTRRALKARQQYYADLGRRSGESRRARKAADDGEHGAAGTAAADPYEAAIAAIVAKAPPLSAETRVRLRSLLAPVSVPEQRTTAALAALTAAALSGTTP